MTVYRPIYPVSWRVSLDGDLSLPWETRSSLEGVGGINPEPATAILAEDGADLVTEDGLNFIVSEM